MISRWPISIGLWVERKYARAISGSVTYIKVGGAGYLAYCLQNVNVLNARFRKHRCIQSPISRNIPVLNARTVLPRDN